MTLLDRVKSLCEAKGISQGKMEKEIGISNGASYKWKTSSPSLGVLEKLSDYFGVSVDYLMTGENKSEQSDNRYYINEETSKMAQSIFENKELRMLFDAARDATPEDLETVHSMLLALKRKERGNIVD